MIATIAVLLIGLAIYALFVFDDWIDRKPRP